MAESIINLHGRGGWEKEKDSGMQCPSRYTSDQQGASCQLGCEPRDMPRFNPPPPPLASSLSQWCVS